jgi:sigma-B regulation protein RsbU (phosphoserine phosphatase)
VRILVVDDSEDSRDLTEGALLSAGHNDFLTASSGADALDVLKSFRKSDGRPAIDVVLLDMVMPEMDGVEACARIRKDERCTDLAIIMVTSLDDMDSLVNAFEAGANDYITKPINRVELVARVRGALRSNASKKSYPDQVSCARAWIIAGLGLMATATFFYIFNAR